MVDDIDDGERAKKIRVLNDTLRTTWLPVTGKVVWTIGIRALTQEVREEVITLVREFKDFNADNDPYGEHDLGTVRTKDGTEIMWKIDYFDHSLEWGSEAPEDPKVTRRVMTIMLSNER